MSSIKISRTHESWPSESLAKQMNEWVNGWILTCLKGNSNETAAMHRKFLPLWQFHKLRHSTINKWRRYNRKCTCIVQQNKADTLWEKEREREREMEWWRQAEEAGRQLQRVCQAAKSVANYAIQRGNSSPTCLSPLSRMLVKTRRQFFSRIAATVYGNCVTQRRKANAKKPKATGRMTCENMQMQNIKSEWIELSLVYGSVWATARRPVACWIRGSPCQGVWSGGW